MAEAVLTRPKTGAALRIVHWLTVLSLAGAWTFIYSKGLFPKGASERDALTVAHMTAGLTVLVLLVPRVLARLSGPLPAIVPHPPRWQEKLAGAMHLALYACLLLIPILGVVFVQAAGHTVQFFGTALPTFVAPDKALAHSIKEVHETLGLALLYLVGAHAAAALWHHFVQRDNTLRRML